MTTRQLLDRAVLRAFNKDISLAGNWEPLDCLAGNESLLAEQVAHLSTTHVDEFRLTRALRSCRFVDEVTSALESEQISTASDSQTGSLFA